MSRIYDAIKCARESRSKNGLDTRGVPRRNGIAGAPRYSEIELDIDLTVYGRSAGEVSFMSKPEP